MSVKSYTTTVTVTAYPTNPQIVNGFEGSVALFNEDAAATVIVSFDGVTDAARLVAGKPSAAQQFNRRYTKVWFKLAAAGSADVQAVFEDR
jgi:hypothetical protein